MLFKRRWLQPYLIPKRYCTWSEHWYNTADDTKRVSTNPWKEQLAWLPCTQTRSMLEYMNNGVKNHAMLDTMSQIEIPRTILCWGFVLLKGERLIWEIIMSDPMEERMQLHPWSINNVAWWFASILIFVWKKGSGFSALAFAFTVEAVCSELEVLSHFDI